MIYWNADYRVIEIGVFYLWSLRVGNMIVIAKVGAPYRLKGESKLYILSDSVETALAYGQWYIQRNQQQQWVKLQDEMVTRLGDKLLIQFDNVNTREEAGAVYQRINWCAKRSLNAYKR